MKVDIDDLSINGLRNEGEEAGKQGNEEMVLS